jgi:predicted O-methyltransferase YrrM
MSATKIKEEISKNWKERHFDLDQRDFFIDLLLKIKPKYCLETGFCTGTSSLTVLATVKPKKMISVSLERNDLDVAKKLQDDYNFSLIEGDSTNILTSEFFQKEFPDGIDFYHVDGGHTFEVALKDLESAYPFMNDGATIIVDDYHSQVCPCEDVNRAVDSFVEAKSLTMEKISTNSGKGMALISL